MATTSVRRCSMRMKTPMRAAKASLESIVKGQK